MRLPREIAASRLMRATGLLAMAGLMAGCNVLGGGAPGPVVANRAMLPTTGPQADYPVLVGEPYIIDGVTHRPNDTLNYDEVGYLAEDSGANGITGSHHTLPVPSYAEVTSLSTGRTILVRLERRGPMGSNHLLALSPAALAQIGATAETPVRVRRVNAPEEQRALLRNGQSAPLRMDTPMALVNVLRRRLPAAPAATSQPQAATEIAVLADAPPAPEPEREPLTLPPAIATEAPVAAVASMEPVQAPAPQPTPAITATDGGFVVQAAAFSTEDRARRAAKALGGVVIASGRFFRVRTGPFANRADAEASLANVRAAGYSDARILTDG